MIDVQWRPDALRPRLRVLAVLLAIAAVALAVIVGLQRRERVRLQVVAENTSKAEQLKLALDGRFPIGTAESNVVIFLDEQHSGYIRSPRGSWVEYGLPVGTEPSDVWYCGSWTRGVTLRFESGRLARSTVTRWSTDCL